MRRSFGGGSRGVGGGSGGGGGGGGGGLQMLRTFQRAVRARSGGAGQEPFRHTNSNTDATSANGNRRARQTSYNNKPTTPSATSKFTLSSSTPSPFAPLHFPISAASTAPAWPSCSSPSLTDESDWVCIDGSDDDIAHPVLDDFVFGSVPSMDEVQHAVYSLQEFIEPVSSSYFMEDRSVCNLAKETADKVSGPTGCLQQTSSYGAKLDWIEPSPRLCNSSALQPPYGSDRVYDAFHLLQNEPSVQRMVISLSSDRAVWDAVLKNEAVQEIRDSLNQDDNSSSGGSDEISDPSYAARDILSWMVTNVKAKILELIHNITQAVYELFHHLKSDKATEKNADPLEEKLRASFMLSIVVLLIVVLNRANKA